MAFGLLVIYNFAFNYVTGRACAALMRGWSDGEERMRQTPGCRSFCAWTFCNIQRHTDIRRPQRSVYLKIKLTWFYFFWQCHNYHYFIHEGSFFSFFFYFQDSCCIGFHYVGTYSTDAGCYTNDTVLNTYLKDYYCI